MSAPREVVVTGVGVISPLADEAGALHRALCRGDSGLVPIEFLDTAGLANDQGGEVRGFDATAYLRPGNLRPLDRPAQLATVAAQRALEQAGLDESALAAREVGLVLGTLFGGLHTISAFDRRALEAGPNYAKPLDFANSVINAPAGQIAIWHGLRGVNSTICCGTASGLAALTYAADLVRGGRADILLAGGVEELCYESLLGFERTGHTAARNGRPACPFPFDGRRNGFTLGEGSALLVLESADSARARGARPLARIVGQGNAFDPSRGQDEGSASQALAQAIEEALREAGTSAAAVAAVSAGANGSPAGDRQEALALRRALGSHQPPITAIKGALGESLGAGGAIQVAVLLASLEAGLLPGIHGFETAEAELPGAGLEGRPRPLTGTFGLATALAGEGHAGALLLERLE